jgi:hypothetical protein
MRYHVHEEQLRFDRILFIQACIVYLLLLTQIICVLGMWMESLLERLPEVSSV